MKSIILCCAIVLVTLGVSAQTHSKAPVHLKSGVMKKGNAVWLMKPMMDAETLDNGLKIRPNGTVRTAGGLTKDLSEGDCIGKNGKVVSLNNKDVTDAWIKHGKMYKATRLDKELTLSDGTSVSPDGKMKKSDGTVINLKNDDIVDIADTQ